MTRLFTLALSASIAVTPLPVLAQTQDHAPSDLASSSRLNHAKGEAWNYVKPGLDLARYRTVLIEDTQVYTGADAQFDNIKPEDRTHFAALLTQALRSKLATSPGLAARAGADVLRIKVTLLGAQKTTGGVATAAHVMPLGFVTNAIKSVAGKRGSLTGSVLLAIEFNDAASGELLAAAVRRAAPDALDIAATTSTTDTVKAVADDIAEKLQKRLEKAMKPR